MVRGINKSKIFDDDEDKARFLERLGQNVTDGKCFVYAWVLMLDPFLDYRRVVFMQITHT